jgi:alpha-ketoglutaric semialdehyde dehydrogenase
VTEMVATLDGLSLLGDRTAKMNGVAFHARSPIDGAVLEPAFYPASTDDLEHAATAAASAAADFGATSGRDRAGFLRRIAEELSAVGEALVQRAHLETGLPLPRLQGELGRTTGQLRLFADVVEEGSWVNARIDAADPDRKPLPKPDLRSMLRPLGPVAVFGASNFPLAFSVAGGDSASALAGGNPVIVKAHPAHPGTSEIAGRAIVRAVAACGMPAGVFSLLFDDGIDVGVKLVQHPAIKAVAFTGSAGGGKALMKLAASRPEPIPCYAEMGSTNPLFILPGALRERAEALAKGLQTSFTLGSGQFCTKPGLVFVPQQGSANFLQELKAGVAALGRQGMLTHGIAARYADAIRKRMNAGEAEFFAGSEAVTEGDAATAAPAVFGVSLDEFQAHPELGEEVFGPTTLLVHYGETRDLFEAAQKLEGHLTATIHGTDEDLANAGALIRVLETKVGRILFNGFPTGVEVAHAMVHGGPFPATSDGRSTSVGTQAIFRFARPVCYQEFTDGALPIELRRSNPAGIFRLVNGAFTRDAQA